MGIINATDDSFSGDGVADRLDEALALTHELVGGAVDIIDIGGASSRPGAEPTPIDVERKRAVRVIEAVRVELDRIGADLPISVDTTWAEVAAPALDAGATVVNDITGFRLDPDMAPLVAERGAAAVLMHNQRGRPHTDLVARCDRGSRSQPPDLRRGRREHGPHRGRSRVRVRLRRLAEPRDDAPPAGAGGRWSCRCSSARRASPPSGR